MARKTETETNIKNKAVAKHNVSLATGIITSQYSAELEECLHDDSPVPSLLLIQTSTKEPQPEEETPRQETLAAKETQAMLPKKKKGKFFVVASMVGACLFLMGFTMARLYYINQTRYSTNDDFTKPGINSEDDLPYVISSLPDGFKCVEVSPLSNVTQVRYADEAGAFIIFLQAATDSNFGIDNEAETETVRLSSGNMAYLYKKDEAITIFWRDKDTFLSVTAKLEKDVLIETVNSIKTNK